MKQRSSVAALWFLFLMHCSSQPAPRAAPAPPSSSAVRSYAPAPSTVPSSPVSLYPGQAVVASEWEDRCTARRACAPVPSIPRCAQADKDAARTFDAAWGEHLSLVGQRIVVRGHLVASGGCTEMGCARPACCNGCFGQVVLVSRATRGADSQSFALSASEERGGPFTCTGDDSAVCCNFAADGRAVIVRGTVTSSHGRYVLGQPEVCDPS